MRKDEAQKLLQSENARRASLQYAPPPPPPPPRALAPAYGPPGSYAPPASYAPPTSYAAPSSYAPHMAYAAPMPQAAFGAPRPYAPNAGPIAGPPPNPPKPDPKKNNLFPKQPVNASNSEESGACLPPLTERKVSWARTPAEMEIESDWSPRFRSLLLLLTFCCSVVVFNETMNTMLYVTVDGGMDREFQVYVVYTVFFACTATLTPFIINLFGRRLCLLVGMCGHVLTMSAKFSGNLFFRIPSAIILGSMGAMLWGAQLSLLASCATKKALVEGADVQSAVRFSVALLQVFFQLAQALGSLGTYLCYEQWGSDFSTWETECGPNYRDSLNNNISNVMDSTAEGPVDFFSSSAYRTSLGVSVGLAAIAFLAFLIVSEEDGDSKLHYFIGYSDRHSAAVESPPGSFIATLLTHMDCQFVLLILPFLWMGYQTYLAYSLQKSYPGCGAQPSHPALLLLVKGLAGSVTAVSMCLVNIRTVAIFLTSCVLHFPVAVSIAVISTRPPDVVFYIMAVCWGAAEALLVIALTWKTMTLFEGSHNTLETALCSTLIWQSIGSVLELSLFHYESMWTVCMTAFPLYCLALLSYVCLELSNKCLNENNENKKNSRTSDQKNKRRANKPILTNHGR